MRKATTACGSWGSRRLCDVVLTRRLITKPFWGPCCSSFCSPTTTRRRTWPSKTSSSPWLVVFHHPTSPIPRFGPSDQLATSAMHDARTVCGPIVARRTERCWPSCQPEEGLTNRGCSQRARADLQDTTHQVKRTITVGVPASEQDEEGCP